MSSLTRNLLLAGLALGLAIVPLLIVRDAEWAGADDRGRDAIAELNRDYEPWFSPLFEPGDSETVLFGLQALLGTAVVAGALGWLAGRRSSASSAGARDRDLRIALGLALVAVLALVALGFVRTEFDELKTLVRGSQGVCLGSLAFLAAYPFGKRYARARRRDDATGA